MIKSFVSKKIVIEKSAIHGKGMFAKEFIKKGEVVFIKGGHILEKSEVFSSEKINSYLPIDDFYFIGAKEKKEEELIKLYINHSCNPNCGLRGEITFVAITDINQNEELRCDYAFIDNEDYSFKCTCGNENCRKVITGTDWKIKEIQAKFKSYFSTYLIKKINQYASLR